MIRVKEPATPGETDGLDTLRIWSAKLQEVWFIHGHAASKETVAQFWWFRASFFASISDPVNELESLRELARLVEPPYAFQFPFRY